MSTMADLYQNRENGFTLIELLISMAVGLIVMGAVVSTFVIQRRTFDIQEQISEMTQNARASMDLMTREIRMAGYNPTGATFDGVTYSTTALKIQADLNGDGNTASGSNEIITYSYDGTNKQIDRKLGTAGTPNALAENIQAFTFQYLGSNGAATATSASVREIRITITARTAKPDNNYGQNSGYRTYTLTTLITPPNLSY
jgi:type IV pilus assembly protein PilW